MLIIPAVDIKNGKCVRLTQGKPDTEVIYQDDPVKAALHWQNKGAGYLHIVDLDGAFSGITVNYKIIKNILSVINIPAQVGGGIRSFEDIGKYTEAGANRIILGTKAVVEPEFLKKAVDTFGEKIAVAIDASKGKIVVEGWAKATDISALDLARKIGDIGIKTIIYTDTKVDGTLKGPNFKGIEDFVKAVHTPSSIPLPAGERCPSGRVRGNIIVSGGIASMDDIQRIKTLEPEGVLGIIIGKALYTGKLKPEELWSG